MRFIFIVTGYSENATFYGDAKVLTGFSIESQINAMSKTVSEAQLIDGVALEW